MCIAQLSQCCYCSFYKVVRVRGSLRFCQDIRHADTFKNCTHSTACNNSRTRGGRKDKYSGTAEFCGLLVRNRAFKYRYLYQILLSRLHAFGNSCRNLTCLTKAITDYALTVTDYNNSCESECSTTFCNLSYPIKRYQFLGKLFSVYINSICHNQLKFKSALARTISNFHNSSVIQISITVKNNLRDTCLYGEFSNLFSNYCSLLTLWHFLHAKRRCRN